MKIGNLEVYGVIYKVTNKINNKVYIGQTVQGFRRRYHRKGNNSVEKLYNSNENEHLKYSIRKYGIDNFYINECFDVAFSFKELNISKLFRHITFFDIRGILPLKYCSFFYLT